MSDIFTEIKSKARLVFEIEKRGVTLLNGGSGGRLKCCCPIHNEKTPSFFVYEVETEKENWHCFGCKNGGSVIDFIMHVEKWNIRQALQYFKQNYDIQSVGEIPSMSMSENFSDRPQYLENALRAVMLRCSQMVHKYIEHSENKNDALIKMKPYLKGMDEAMSDKNYGIVELYYKLLETELFKIPKTDS